MTELRSTPQLDGLYEAARGLWPSALESFVTALAQTPQDLGLILATAIAHLRCDAPQAALVLLETHPGLKCAHGVWAMRRDWLTAAARLAVGDVQGAEWAVAQAAPQMRAQVMAHLAFQNGEYSAGAAWLIKGRNRS